MQIEKKPLTETATLFYFSTPLNIIGTIYQTKDIIPKPLNPLTDNIIKSDLAKLVMLTTDFIYFEAANSALKNTLEALVLAEVDDYISSFNKPFYADNTSSIIKINLILQTIIAPFLQHDGGDIEYQNLDDNVLTVRFLGKCNGCPYAQNTLKNRVEKNITRYLPSIREVKLA